MLSCEPKNFPEISFVISELTGAPPSASFVSSTPEFNSTEPVIFSCCSGISTISVKFNSDCSCISIF